MPPTPRTVLVADDDPDIGVLLARIMRRYGLTPLVVMNGSDAISAAQHNDELVAAFLDIHMPGITGVDAAIAIQKLLPQLPIVLMSAGIPANLASSVAQLSLSGFLQKPFQIMTCEHCFRNLDLLVRRHK